MSLITESEIQRQLAGYIARALSREVFEDWLGTASWDMQHESTPEAQRLVGAIELRLAEHSAGHLSDDDLHRQLDALRDRP